jgi:hypothetical protein
MPSDHEIAAHAGPQLAQHLLVSAEKLSFDVLIGNLPHVVTESLLGLLPRLSFRIAVLVSRIVRVVPPVLS